MARDESPIEAALRDALLADNVHDQRQLFLDDHTGTAELEFCDGELLKHGHALRPTGSIWLCDQVAVGRYALDLLLWSHSVLAIECDGHDWHERTPEQAAHDRRRDRAVLRTGIPTIRFTGREILRNPDGCAIEVIDTFLALERRRRLIEIHAPTTSEDNRRLAKAMELGYHEGFFAGWQRAGEHRLEAMAVDLDAPDVRPVMVERECVECRGHKQLPIDSFRAFCVDCDDRTSFQRVE